MKILMVRPPVCQSMDQPRIPVIGKYNGLVCGKKRVKFRIRQTMRVLFLGLKCHQVDYIDHPYFQIGYVRAEKINCCKCLKCRDISGTCHNHVRFTSLIVACPLPDTDT